MHLKEIGCDTEFKKVPLYHQPKFNFLRCKGAGKQDQFVRVDEDAEWVGKHVVGVVLTGL